MQQDYEMFKIVVIGSMSTGKTNISTRYIRNEYTEGLKATVGVEFLSKIVQVRNQNIKVTLWDTAGQERYKSLSKVYYKGASGILIVYDVTEPQTYLDVESWMRLANENLNLNEVVLMVVGNKVDLEADRKVPAERVQKEYKEKFDIDCWQVSAKTGFNVKEVFSELLEKIYEKNIQIKSSVFHEENEWGASLVSPESVVAPARIMKKDTKKPAAAVQEIVIEESREDKIIPTMKNPETKNNFPVANRVTLTVKDDKNKGERVKEKKSCC